MLRLIMVFFVAFLFFITLSAFSQEPMYIIQIGYGDDASMIWKSVIPQPVLTITTGTITETHNYFGLFGQQKWAFLHGNQRIEFPLTITDTAMKRVKIRVALVYASQTSEWAVSEPVFNYASNVISTVIHLLNGG